MGGGVRVNTNSVMPLLAQEPVDRDAVNLACDIVQGHVHRTVAAAHAPVPGELAQRPQVALDIQRILAQQVRLEDERNAFHSGVAHFAQAVNVLVGPYLDERIVVIRGQPAGSHVRDLQPAGRRIAIHWFLRAHRTFRRLEYGTKHGRRRSAPQHRAARQP